MGTVLSEWDPATPEPVFGPTDEACRAISDSRREQAARDARERRRTTRDRGRGQIEPLGAVNCDGGRRCDLVVRGGCCALSSEAPTGDSVSWAEKDVASAQVVSARDGSGTLSSASTQVCGRPRRRCDGRVWGPAWAGRGHVAATGPQFATFGRRAA